MSPLSTLLKRTTSRCLVCHALCPAEVSRVAGKIYLNRTCPEHGAKTTLLSSDARFYHLAKGDPGNGGCGASCDCGPEPKSTPLGKNAPGRVGEPFETLSTCLALIEIVDSCNLSCPTCFADSPIGVGSKLKFTPIDDVKARVQGVIDRKRPIEILQLSGGEPTLHPRFFEIVEWVHENPAIDYLLINTNGVLIAKDDAFLAKLGEAMRYGHTQLYLQFDGTGDEAQNALRGADLREMKTRAVERCGEIGLPITLAMTVVPENIDELWSTVEFGLRYPHVRGVAFQPMFGSGRHDKQDAPRLNTADIILSAIEQSTGTLSVDDFTPLPCGDPNCATVGYLLKVGGAVRSISDFVDFTELQGFLHDKIRYSLEDLAKCGCDSEPLGELLKQFELDESHTFRLFIKPFMDAHSWDDDRIDRCCTHVIRPDGQLDSFCRYYSGFSDCSPAP